MSQDAHHLSFSDIRGARLAWRLDGDPAAPVVMLSNSLLSTHAMWDRNMAALLERYRVLRYDTRGHGQSQVTPGPYSIEMLADDAAALVRQANVGRVHFLGLSKGGMTAQQFALRHPQLLRSIVLCDTASEMPTRAMWDTRLATARSEGVPGLLESTLKRWFVPGFAERDPQAIEAVRGFILANTAEGYIACASAVRDMSQTHLLKHIAVPAHIIVGRDDPACTLAQSQVLQREIPGAQLSVIDNAAHLSNIEQPAEFNRLVRAFLDAQPR